MEQLQQEVEVNAELREPKEYIPSKQEVLSFYEINIQFMSRGCVIRIGCKSIPFSSTDEAIAELQKYFDKPHDTQREWNKKLC